MSDRSKKSNQSREGYSSPPCFAHELDQEDFSIDHVPKWRKAMRKKLIEDRLSIPSGTRREFSGKIATFLDQEVGGIEGLICSFYWPFRGEPDLRDLMERWYHRGAICALPCVVNRDAPMVFRIWEPGCEMKRGIWNIPVPADSNEVLPDVVIAPLVGFDKAGYRLGYGGGYFDRTLAAMTEKPKAFGVGFSRCELDSIYPRDFDIPMDVIVTELGTG